MSDKEPTNSNNTALDNTEKLIEDGVVIESDADTTPKKVKTGGLWLFSIFNFLLIIGICAAAGWTWYQWQQNQTNETDTGDKIEAKLSSIDSVIAKLNSAVSASQDELAKINNDLTQQNQTLSNNVDGLLEQILQNANENKALQSRVADLSGRRPADWLLAEADYLVRIAGRKLWLENDVSTAMLMMQAADSRLEDIGDPSLFPVRKLIAEDIQALHQVNPVAINSIALALSGMIPQVNNLPLNALKIPEIEENKAQNELSENIGDWRSNLSKTWDSLVDDFIQIETSEKPVLPYLSTKQRWLITEQLKLALSQAKSAALDEQEALYMNALQQATALVVEHFQLDDNNVKQFADALQQLQNTTIAKDYPRQLKSANALKDVIEQRVQSVFKNDTGEGAL
ncbi:uroporphyrinogen-III C-methyltransferase [Brumicola nitratireducens]|uniref:Uroporphyrin-III C-methyltransferase n=1 Tax=Glaciecola nitratireducens (strain JCM 12485 / KCTC 12276 / FR1064) TaxID=1085623 RepID=G4QF15_GLANF|nr:uroporphyrinogen-III C-methyltransferase [Glaciecola nitratireducens]AEP28359.1 uroporphyrin-III C-methyltransferase [Glaciecola nitratireducens FR1064]